MANGQNSGNVWGYVAQGASDAAKPMWAAMFRKGANRAQLRQQKKLMALEMKGSKEMADYNHNLAMEAWEKTNAEAQANQYREAGLNIGLMYEGGGPGGMAIQGTGASPSGGNAAYDNSGANLMGIEANQIALMKAQKENIEADTENKKASTEKTTGVDTAETAARTAKLQADTGNAQLDGVIKTYQGQIAKIESELKSYGQDFVEQQIWRATDKLIAETESAMANAKVDKATADEKIKQAVIETTSASLKAELTQQNIKYTQAQVDKVAQEIVNMASELDENGKNRRIELDAIRTEFSSGDEAKWIRWIETTGGAVSKAMSARGGLGGIKGKGLQNTTDKGKFNYKKK